MPTTTNAPPAGGSGRAVLRPSSVRTKATTYGGVAALTEPARRIASSLIAIQVRISELNTQTVCCPNALYSANQGPEPDINAVILPHNKTSLLVGANNIGYTPTTANVALIQSLSPNFRVGGGVLYSQFGFLAAYSDRLFGFDTKIYNIQRPDIDLYGNLNVAKHFQLFVGERALNHAERRFTFGFQTKIP